MTVAARDVKGILFDLDGTLLDTHRLLLASFRHTVDRVLGTYIPDECFMATVGQPLEIQMWAFTDDAAVHKELCQTYRRYTVCMHDTLIEVFPGTIETVEELRQAGYPLGVVTSKRHEPALKGLSFFGLDAYVEFLVGSDDWPTHKPDPGPIEHGCDLMGLRPDECLYVGDSPFDMQASRAAGCVGVAALWGMFSAAELEAEHPDFICADIRTLPRLVMLR